MQEDSLFNERYLRQIALPEIGEGGQKKLHGSKVAIIGLGGLGSPAALYLAAAGVGKLVLVDDDVVSLSNLQRQIIHGESTLGTPKVDSAWKRINALNVDCVVTAYQCKLTAKNAGQIVAGCGVVIDATDNFAARFVINDAANKIGIPLIYGAIRRFEGQISVFEPHKGTGCYQCLHQDNASFRDNDDASAEGVLGPVPGIIGSLQAMEAIKSLVGIPTPLSGSMLAIDLLNMQFRQIKLKPDPNCSCQ